MELRHKEKFDGKTYHEEIDWIVGHQPRNNFIRNLALSLEGNTLVLYNRVEDHGQPLYRLIKDKAEEDRRVFFISGQVDTMEREEIRKIVDKSSNGIIVASLGTFSTGINIRNLHNIIFASPSKSQIRVLQSIGRGLRKSENGKATTLYDIIDNLYNNKRKNFALVHSEERLKIYKKENFNFKTYKVEL